MTASLADLSRDIASTVGVFRAEYLKDAEFFRYLERPEYWSRLEGRRACFLVGGRGTGKTTALRALSYDSQAQFNGPDPRRWDTVGFYWRVDTSVVTAFRGSRVEDLQWQKLFAHFVNLQLMRSVMDFVRWFERQDSGPLEVDAEHLRLASAALGVEPVETLSEFGASLRLAATKFETDVNTSGGMRTQSPLSVLGVPLGHLVSALKSDPRFSQHYFTFAIDEYENLAPYQQRVVNTLIKHAGDSDYTFKVGVKEKGVIDRSTLGSSEFLSEPADYITIHVENSLKQQGFSEFAERICNDRLAQIPGASSVEIRGLLPEVSDEEEAVLLGGPRRRLEIRAEFIAEGADERTLAQYDAMTLLSACMVGYWAQSSRKSLQTVLREALDRPDQWQNRLNNYGFAMLFTLRQRVAGLRKLYAGWSVFAHLADGNIRHLLALVAETLGRHVVGGNKLDTPVTPQVQTQAAEHVGERACFELAGLHARGSEIMRLTLGLGRVFGVMAHDPHGHTPEVTQFRVDRSAVDDLKHLDELLAAAVMHGAIVTFPGDKNSARSGNTKEHDYQIHPIFAAFFAYSYRSKRRIMLNGSEVLSLASSAPQGTVSKVLRRNARNPSSDLPPQLELLAEFFQDA